MSAASVILAGAALVSGCIATDGDSLRCGSEKIRLVGIDAPEMGQCRPRGRVCAPGDPQASRRNLSRLTDRRRLDIERIKFDRYGRTIARVTVNGRDLSCAQLRGGFALYRHQWDEGRRLAGACRPFGANIRDGFDDIPNSSATGSRHGR